MKNGDTPDSEFFRLLSTQTASSDSKAPARLKSRVYSALVNRMETSGPLLPMGPTEAAYGLCVFEKLVEIAPLSEKGKAFNACSVCHARVLAERLEHPPIYWKHCPYVEFQGG